MKILAIFDNFGPYHIARLAALAKHCDLAAIELRTESREYAWASAESTPFMRVTLRDSSMDQLQQALEAASPDVVFVPGWSDAAALATLAWADSHRVPAVVMSDSQEIDFPRVFWKERIKHWTLASAAGLLVAGEVHRDYAIKLGAHPDRIRLGYDAVDNAYFSASADGVRADEDAARTSIGVVGRYFLASARFIEKKNIFRMLEAFARARAASGSDWVFVLLGDGILRPQIKQAIGELGLEGAVLLPGFKQYDELPRWYGLAEAFVLASTSEQWGLVVNEAMASGLPVVVSNRCGSAAELVVEGETGFSFDPYNVDALAGLMQTLMSMTDGERRAMGQKARQQVARFSPDGFGSNALELARIVTTTPIRRASPWSRAVLRALAWKAGRHRRGA